MNAILFDTSGLHLMCNGKEIGIRDTSNDYPSVSCIWDTLHSQKELPHNCVNCGAPLHGDKCEYCGTEY